MSMLGGTNGKHASLRVQKPQARTDELVVEEFGDELLIHDSENNRAHSLGPIAASVWRACDGTLGADALADRLELSGFDTSRALDELEALGLLDRQGIDVLQSDSTNGVDSGITRRQMTMRSVKAGAAVMTVPLVYSINVSPALATLTPTPFQCEIFTTKSCGASTACGSIAGCCCCCQGGGSCKTCGAIAFCNAGNQPCSAVQGGGFGSKCSDAKGTFPANPRGCCGVTGSDDCGCGFGPFANCCTPTNGVACAPSASNSGCFPCCNGEQLTSVGALDCCKSAFTNCCSASPAACCARSTINTDCCGPNPPACCATSTCR